MASTSTPRTAKRRAPDQLSRTSRFAALATGAMASMVLGEVAWGSTHGYGMLLVGALALGAYVAAGRMWQRNCFESKLAVIVLSGLIVVGQVMVAVIGSPGAEDDSISWTPASTLVLVLALLAVALVAADARERPTRTEHPYAL